MAQANALDGTIRTQAAAAAHAPGASPAAPTLLLPVLNEVFNIGATRVTALTIHPPAIIVQMLFSLALASALLAGYAMAGGK